MIYRSIDRKGGGHTDKQVHWPVEYNYVDLCEVRCETYLCRVACRHVGMCACKQLGVRRLTGALGTTRNA
jgi:hypothetical protein